MHDWGISMGYHDVAGHWREVSPETLTAIRRAMGAPAAVGEGPAPAGTSPHDDPVVSFRPGRAPAGITGGGPWELHTEDGAVVAVDSGAPLPADLPLGYHRLRRVGDGWERLLIVSPGRCHLPPDLRTWGWAAQLYATRSRESWGMGDLGDLRRLARWSQRLGAGMCLLNPLHATVPAYPQASPYYPSSRCFRNPLYLRIEDVPGALDTGDEPFDLPSLAAEGRALNGDRRIDRDRVWKLKATALEHLWRRFTAHGGDPAFDAFCADQGEALTGFGTHCALTERFPGAWADWPEEYRRPDSPAVARFAADHAERVGFHSWLQWLTESQLASAGSGIDLMQDLAVGVDPGGADAWLWQDTMALGMRVGAPPDDFNTKGQDWSLPPFDPWRLRLARYDPWIRTVRAGLRAAGGIRVDHVMGLFRLYWIPVGTSAADGAYVHYRHEEMLDILALESHRAGAYVVGEDLGTVEDFVRHELHERGVLSYRLLWFEPQRPPEFPHQALAAVTTHDLPTVAGVWTGLDSPDSMRARLVARTGLDVDAPVQEAVAAAYRAVGEAPSALVAVSLDDVLEVRERPNYPGDDDRPNWSLAVPMTLESITTDERVRAVAAELSDRSKPTP